LFGNTRSLVGKRPTVPYRDRRQGSSFSAQTPFRDQIFPGNLVSFKELSPTQPLRIELQDDVPVEQPPGILDKETMGMAGDKLALQDTAELGDVIGDRILPGPLRCVGDAHLLQLSENS